MRKQVELSITHNGKDVVAYPYTKKEHVQFENGMNIDEFVGQDIATPTITHDTTAIKVGVGDSDVSSSVVDSAVNMTIKGQTYQNILPDPTLRNEMQGKSMQRLNEGYDSIETVDGVSKSAILKGQTLVNLVTQKSGSFNGERFLRIPLRYTLKTNVKYFVKFNVRESSLTDGVACRLRIDTNGGVVGSLSSDGIILVNGEGYNYIEFYIKNSDDVTNGADAIIDDITLIEYQEGMENWDIPYFEGMTSCKMPVLKTTGKNLCKYRSDWVNNGLTFAHTNDGVTVNGTATAYVDYYVTTKDGSINAETLDVLNSLQVGTRLFLSNNLGKNSYISYRLNGETKYRDNVTIQNGMEIIGAFVRFQQGDICNNLNLTIQLEIGNEATSYEPHKSNILHTPEEVVLKGIGDAQDTLNCNTGEYVERIKEVVFDGSDDENWVLVSPPPTDTTLIRFDIEGQIVNGVQIGSNKKLLCDKLPYIYLHTSSGSASMTQECVSNHSQDPNRINVVIKKERLSTPDVTGFKQWLQSNNLPIQYEVATPTVKTVDLTTSGNWEKVVLDGSESWTRSMTNNNYFMETNISILPNRVPNVENYFIHDSSLEITKVYTSNTNIGICIPSNGGIRIRTIEVQKGQTLEEFKQYLQQNPITVWYQTTTTQDNSIREMLFFANGHLQVSSEAENSLLPSVQYEIPTKNSYHMDLMKAGTWTVKSESCSGVMYIGDESLHFGLNSTNRIVMLGQSQLDNLPNNLWYFKGAFKDGMVLEGDLTSKIIPYFKGIKSAFESEEEVEIVSTGKNLFDISKWSSHLHAGHGDFIVKAGIVAVTPQRDDCFSDTGVWTSGILNDRYRKMSFKCKENIAYTCSFNINLNKPSSSYICFFDEEYRVLSYHKFNVGGTTIVSPKGAKHFTLRVGVQSAIGELVTFSEIQIVEGEKKVTYEPYKSNITKIPLLSPLRSLPNGICDELIIDRLNHKAKLIQRIGYEVLNENTAFSSYPTMEKEKTLLFQTQNANPQGASTYCISDQFIHRNNLWDSSDSDTEAIMIGGGEGNIGKRIDFRISKAKVSTNNVTILQDYLSKEPITVLYQLNIPIITEIDLEGYPYIYKDGHIFLNSDIAPTTQITYSINQAQQIESANENLQRHEKEISHLQKLIAQYIQVEYESTLLSLKI